MYGCEIWTIKKAEHWRIDAFELNTIQKRVPWTARGPVNPKGNQPWIFIGRTDAEAEPPILWPPDAKSWFIGKKPWCLERLKTGKGDDRVWDGWMASLTQWTRIWASSGGDGEGQESLGCCNPLGRRESDWFKNSMGEILSGEWVIQTT